MKYIDSKKADPVHKQRYILMLKHNTSDCNCCKKLDQCIVSQFFLDFHIVFITKTYIDLLQLKLLC